MFPLAVYLGSYGPSRVERWRTCPCYRPVDKDESTILPGRRYSQDPGYLVGARVGGYFTIGCTCRSDYSDSLKSQSFFPGTRTIPKKCSYPLEFDSFPTQLYYSWQLSSIRSCIQSSLSRILSNRANRLIHLAQICFTYKINKTLRPCPPVSSPPTPSSY
jgi:hypothetical protein